MEHISISKKMSDKKWGKLEKAVQRKKLFPLLQRERKDIEKKRYWKCKSLNNL